MPEITDEAMITLADIGQLMMGSSCSTPESFSRILSGSSTYINKSELSRHPVAIHPTEVGRLNEDEEGEVVSLAIDCERGGVKIWAFGSRGKARVWDLGERSVCTHANDEELKINTAPDGAVVNDNKHIRFA